MKTTKPIASLDKVSKRFPDRWRRRHHLGGFFNALLDRPDPHAVHVLRDIDLAVYRGQAVALIGDNGAGKSTALKILTGVYLPSAGKSVRRGQVGALLELGAGFHPDLTGRENLYMSGALLGLGRRQIKALLPAILEFSELGDRIDEPLRHYSSGMVVRLGFALLATTCPDVLISDEVLAVGDESFQRRCQQWMKDYLDQGGTLLVVTHSLDHAVRLCAQAFWLDHGQIRAQGPSAEVVRAYREHLRHREIKGGGSADHYRVTRVSINDTPSGTVVLAGARTLRAQMDLYSPDGRPPVVAAGIRDGADAAVFGTTSEMDDAKPQRLSENHFRFDLTFSCQPLKPGRYQFTAHAMDPEALRLFDTTTRDFEIPGEKVGAGYLCADVPDLPGESLANGDPGSEAL